MYRQVYTCDECGAERRRITVHMPAVVSYGEPRDLHFCSAKCMEDFASDPEHFAVRDHIDCADIADGA